MFIVKCGLTTNFSLQIVKETSQTSMEGWTWASDKIRTKTLRRKPSKTVDWLKIKWLNKKKRENRRIFFSSIFPTKHEILTIPQKISVISQVYDCFQALLDWILASPAQAVVQHYQIFGQVVKSQACPCCEHAYLSWTALWLTSGYNFGCKCTCGTAFPCYGTAAWLISTTKTIGNAKWFTTVVCNLRLNPCVVNPLVFWFFVVLTFFWDGVQYWTHVYGNIWLKRFCAVSWTFVGSLSSGLAILFRAVIAGWAGRVSLLTAHRTLRFLVTHKATPM